MNIQVSYNSLMLIIAGLTIFRVISSEPISNADFDKEDFMHNGDSYLEEIMGKRDEGGFSKNSHQIPLGRRADDFFLKASKSVPRIGRRGDDFFLKASKNVPRVGRRNGEFLKAAKSVPRIGKKNNDPFLIGVKTVPRIGRSDSAVQQTLPIQKRDDSIVAADDGGLWGVWPWFRNQDYMQPFTKRSSYILSSPNDLPLHDKQAIWGPMDTIAQEVEIGPPIYFAEQV